MKLTAKVNNVAITAKDVEKYGKYIVARYEGIELWYYGIYETRKRAEEVAYEINNGIVLEADTTDDDILKSIELSEKIAKDYPKNSEEYAYVQAVGYERLVKITTGKE